MDSLEPELTESSSPRVRLSLGTSTAETLTAGLSRRFASRHSRRSFVGRVSKYSIALTAGMAAANRVVEPAFGTLICDCGNAEQCGSGCTGDRPCPSGCDHCGHSISCLKLTGQGGSCPSGTAYCGAWICSCDSCPSGFKQWSDCCANADQCSAESSCRCPSDTDGESRVTCCLRHCYAGGQDDCHFIYCRVTHCT